MTRPMHIVIDARWIFREISGIGLYTQELIAALARLESPHRFTLMFNDAGVMERTATQTLFTAKDSFSAVTIRGGPFSPLDQVRLPTLLRRMGADVFHAPNYMMPLWTPGRTRRVVTIHDLIPLLFRDYAPRSRKNRLFPVFKWLMNTAARKADLIIAVSKSTRQDILNHLLVGQASRPEVVVVPEGVRSVCVPAARSARDDIEFLFVGRRDPYKNLPLLVEALADARKGGWPARLRVVGGPDPRYPEAERVARERGVEAYITWSGYVADEDLIAAYQQADVFVLPSNYEGFGLPVLEAMACGTPVICSSTSSLPEVAGDAALFIDPERPQTLVEAMIRMIREPLLREEYARRGRARAARFSWDETARLTLAAYESLTPA